MLSSPLSRPASRHPRSESAAQGISRRPAFAQNQYDLPESGFCVTKDDDTHMAGSRRTEALHSWGTLKMGYLIAQLWPFLLLALLVGIAVGWFSVEP